MPEYRPAERVRQLAEAARSHGSEVTLQLAREVQADPDPAAILAALATVAAGCIDMVARRTGQPFSLTLQRLLGAIPGPLPGDDPDLGL
jgi:hypothetical protein